MGGVNSESSEHAGPKGITFGQICAQVRRSPWHVYLLLCGVRTHFHSQFLDEMCELFLWRWRFTSFATLHRYKHILNRKKCQVFFAKK